MLPVACVRAVGGDDGPPVLQRPVGLIAGGQHRLDAQHHAGPELGTARTGAVVGDVGLLVHGRADAVPHVVLDDARRIGQAHDVVVDGPADVADAPSRGECGDTPPHGLASDGAQALPGLPRRSVASVEDDGERGVAVPSVEDGSAVEGDEVARLENPLPRDAVDDLVVDGHADLRRIAPVPVEIRPSPAGGEDVEGDGVHLGGRRPRAGRGAKRLVDPGHDESRGAHAEDVPVGLVLDGHRLYSTAVSAIRGRRPARRRPWRRPRRSRRSRRRTRGRPWSGIRR